MSNVKLVPGTQVAWKRGPSGGLVIGTLIGESERSPERWWSRASDRTDHDVAPLQRLWDCVAERYNDNWPNPRGHKWVVPECDFVEVPP